MSELSHESVDLGLKLADLFAAEGYTREASDQLLTVAGLLAERGERDRSEKVLARLLETHGDIAEGLRVVQELYDEKGAGTKASMVADLGHEVGRHGDLPTVVRRLWGIEASDSAALMSEPPLPPPHAAAPHAPLPEPEHEEPHRDKVVDRKSLDDEIESFIQSYNWSDEANAEAAAGGARGREPDFLGGGEDPFAAGGPPSDAFSYESPPTSGNDLHADEPLDQWANPAPSEGVEDVLTRALSEDGTGDLEHRGEAAAASWLDVGEPAAPAAFGDEDDPAFYRVETEADDRIRLKSDRDYLDKMPSQIDPESLNPNNAEIFTRSGFERVFGEFKKGLEQQIGVEDADTHYNLGIAYKEMALIDDAIHEFEIAAQDPTWRADALTMIALCHEDNEDLETAIDFLKEALDSEGVTQEKATGLLYEIGLAHEALARYDEAYDYFSKVYAVDEDYRNVKKKLADLLKEL
ncbi:MAG: tetratricopeptide repeat protein [Deltaproteobacteria bacterium]|nr:tetratricopeptide repeat protein [Deltaproteobacteria bacterium]